MRDGTKAQLIHIDVDRRLGHEWDEWDGKPLPNGGSYDTPESTFYRWSALALATGFVLVAALVLLLAPRLAMLHPNLPVLSWRALVALFALTVVWWIGLVIAGTTGRVIWPPLLSERGGFLWLMRWTSLFARRFGRRDWVENAAVKVYNAIALARVRQIRQGELLLLVPRCLSRETLDGVLHLAGRYDVPVFVATRGQLARRVIRERRPRAVVAVACERDMVTGLHDVAGKVPVLGLTMTLPAGPCKDAGLDLGQLERYVQAFVG